jgi:hypothetical protein
MLLEPGEEHASGPVLGHARVPVADLGGEKFEEAAGGMVAGVGDHRRHREITNRAKAPAGAFHDKLGKGARPNHVGTAIARFKRAGRIEERDGRLYAT